MFFLAGSPSFGCTLVHQLKSYMSETAIRKLRSLGVKWVKKYQKINFTHKNTFSIPLMLYERIVSTVYKI